MLLGVFDFKFDSVNFYLHGVIAKKFVLILMVSTEKQKSLLKTKTDAKTTVFVNINRYRKITLDV